MDVEASPVTGVRSRSTEPRGGSHSLEKEGSMLSAESSTVHDAAGNFAAASSEALEPFQSSLLASHEKAETADSLPHELSELTALQSLGDEPITASTLQRRMPTLRQTYRSTAPSQPTLDSLAGPASKSQDVPAPSKAEPIPEGTVPLDTEKRNTYASFWSYCQAEVNFNMKGTSSSSLFGETTRDKLYNSLFLVGPHLERYMAVGFLKCLDYLLGVMLLLPLQAGAAFLALTRNPLKLRSIEIFHVAMLVVFVCSCTTMIHVRAGGIYFWLKDISPVFLKIHAVYNALDILNKVFRSFAVDAVASMSSSCSAIAGSGSASERLHALLQLLSDSALSWLLISLNSLTMMTQAIIYSVALNSGKNELVALMIATSFMEVKGVVYKRYDEHKLLDMARMDLEERFTLFVALAFVVAEDLLSTGQLLVDGSMVWECVKIFLCEMLVDVLKHVTLAKFNNVRPGTYREFFRSLVKDAQYSQGYAFNSVANVDQFGCAALLARQGFSLWSMTRNAACEAEMARDPLSDVDYRDCIDCTPTSQQMGFTPFECSSAGHAASAVAWVGGVGSVMLVYKLGVGFCLHTFVSWYSSYYDNNYKTMFKKRL